MKAFVENLGVVDAFQVTVLNAETTKAVTLKGRTKADYVVSALANYAGAGVWVSAKTKAGFTLNFADPTTTKAIDVVVIGG